MEINNYIQKHEFLTAKLFQIDCLELMKQIPNKWFDLAICDPPYGINVSNYSTFGNPNIIAKNSFLKKPIKPSNYSISNWDNNIPTKIYFKELKRISINQIIFGVNNYDGMELNGGRLFWDKEGTGNYSRGELAYLSFVNRIEYFKFKWCGMLQQDMKNKQIRIHPTEKPIALYKWLLTNYAKPNDKIFDSHGGSMSSVIAAIDYKFDITCSELDIDYYNNAIKRIQNFVNQTTLF